jgi:capsular exopolysaccharide synthesis family protein
MSLNEKTLLTDDPAQTTGYALRPSTPMAENGLGEWTTNVPLSPAESASGPNLGAYLHALRRHWLLASALGILLACGAAAGIWLGVSPRFVADAYLKCDFQQDAIMGQRRVVSDTEFEIFKNTQVQMMTNRLVLYAALQKEVKIGEQKFTIKKLPMIEPEDDKIEWLAKKVSVAFPQRAEVMKVSVSTNNPVYSAAIVTAVKDAYLEEVVEAERKKRDVRISDLKRLSVDKSTEVKDSMNELKKMADILGTSESDTLNMQQKAVLDELASYRGDFIRSQFDLYRMKSELASWNAVLETLESQPVPDIEVQQYVQLDPYMRQISEELVYRKMQSEQWAGAVNPGSKSRAVDQALGGLARLQKQYDDHMEQIRQQCAIKRKGEVQKDIKKLEAMIATTSKQMDVTQEEVKRLQKESFRFGQSSIDMQMRREDIKGRQKSLDSINTELEVLRVEANTAPRVTEISKVVEPPKTDASSMIRLALTGMASLVGFCIPFVGVVVWDMQYSRINGTSDIADQLGLPVIGSVPKIPRKILHEQGSAGKNHQLWQLRLTESVDGISARLLRQAETEQRRVVMVTSAVNGEGKTTLAAQLAMSLARAGRRTLLVDFDLRNPTFDEVFGLPKSPGLSEILRNECDLANCIHASGMENLSVLTAGCWDRFALAALANNCVASMFKELRDEYEFVIVDTSPILPITDARFVSQYVDSVVLSVFRDISESSRIRAACEILEAFGVQSVEAVVTGVNEHLGGKHLGYYQPAETAAS